MLVGGVSVNSFCQQGELFALSVNRHFVKINYPLVPYTGILLMSVQRYEQAVCIDKIVAVIVISICFLPICQKIKTNFISHVMTPLNVRFQLD